MSLSELQLQVAPGDGLVTSLGSVAFVVLPGPGQDQQFIDKLIAVVATTRRTSGADVGRPLIRQLGALITNTPSHQVMPLGIVADADDALAVLVFGPADLSVTMADGRHELISGADATIWVDRLIRGDVDRISIVPSGTVQAPAHPRHDLRMGTVPGSGFTLLSRSVEAAPPAARVAEPAVADSGVAEAEAAASEPASTADAGPTANPPEYSRPPAGPPAPAPSGSESTGQFVSVLVSEPSVEPRGALPLVSDEGGAAASRPGPGRLVQKDGTSVPLEGYLLLGRSPQQAPDVMDGRAVPVVLPDPTRAISRVHASISNDKGVVTVADLESANGTGIAQPGDQEWTRLTPGQPAVLLPGGRVLVGDAELTYVLDTPAEQELEPIAALDSPRTTVSKPGRPQQQQQTGDGVGDYVFVRPLGRGGRGGYFLARPPARLELDAEYVAVKVFTGATSDDTFRRAARELRAVAAAESPYLVKIHDAGQDGGRLFYCMDYFPEGSLAKPAHPLGHDDIVRAVAQAARGAHALHEVGVVHQGIKPRNILLGRDHAYLSDLGVVQPIGAGQSVTSLGTALGDMEYLDPSILTGGHGSRSTDIWSIAATLHHALTGVGVFDNLPSGSLLAIRTVLTQRPRLSPALRADEAELVGSCLQDDVAARPPTALALAEQIEALLDQPSDANPG